MKNTNVLPLLLLHLFTSQY